MQTPQAFPDWVFQVFNGLASFVVGGTIVKLITLYQNRRKPFVEVKKVEAETTAITVKSHSVAGDALLRMMDRLEDALNTQDRLRSERDDLRELSDKQQMEMESYDRQMRRMKAILDLHGLKLSDYDTPEV
jgi:hypothetical protein